MSLAITLTLHPSGYLFRSLSTVFEFGKLFVIILTPFFVGVFIDIFTFVICRILKEDDIMAPPAGTCGTVSYVDDIGSIHVNWDTGSTLAIVYGVDSCMRIREE